MGSPLVLLTSPHLELCYVASIFIILWRTFSSFFFCFFVQTQVGCKRMGEEVLKCVDSQNLVSALRWSINRRTFFFLPYFLFGAIFVMGDHDLSKCPMLQVINADLLLFFFFLFLKLFVAWYFVWIHEQLIIGTYFCPQSIHVQATEFI